MRISRYTAIILSGQSLSSVVDLGIDTRLCKINMPATWDAADLTFRVSEDGFTYRDLYKSDAISGDAEYVVGAAAARSIILPTDDWIGTRFIQVRSGTAGVAVNQTADRNIELIAGR